MSSSNWTRLDDRYQRIRLFSRNPGEAEPHIEEVRVLCSHGREVCEETKAAIEEAISERWSKK